MNKFFYTKDGKMLVNVARIEAYIPSSYFDGKYAAQDGEFIEMLGIFNFKTFTSDTDTKGSPLQTFAIPALIRTKPSSVHKKELSVDGEIEEYNILEYYRDDIMLNSTAIIKSIDNVELFFDMLISGKIPKTIPYSDLSKIILKAVDINGTNLGVPAKIFELMISEICRDSADTSKSFRYTAGSGSFNERGYTPVNLRSVARLSSTFSAITFEDFDAMSISSIKRSRTPNQHETVSPIEAIIKY